MMKVRDIKREEVLLTIFQQSVPTRNVELILATLGQLQTFYKNEKLRIEQDEEHERKTHQIYERPVNQESLDNLKKEIENFQETSEELKYKKLLLMLHYEAFSKLKGDTAICPVCGKEIKELTFIVDTDNIDKIADIKHDDCGAILGKEVYLVFDGDVTKTYHALERLAHNCNVKIKETGNVCV